jgi:hypothetical protein
VKVFPWLTVSHGSLMIMLGVAAGYRKREIPVDSFWWIIRLLIMFSMVIFIASIYENKVTPPDWYMKYNWVVTVIIITFYGICGDFKRKARTSQ